MIDWYRLLAAINVPYRDHGKNTSRKDINICCPFCGDDYGYHLGISLDNPTNYYCFRDPTEHSGSSYPRLLKALGCDTMEIDRLLGDYDSAAQRAVVSPPEPSEIMHLWDRFKPAAESDRCLAYLRYRGFPDAESLCREQQLRYALAGTWAVRLLIPYIEDGKVVSWAGRALRDDITPKMLMQENQHPGLVYVPRMFFAVTNAVIVEGQFDALKIAAARPGYYKAIAISGKAFTASKKLRIARELHGIQNIYLALDSDVKLSTRIKTLHAIREVMERRQNIFHLEIPKGYKDPGDLPLDVAIEWLP